jgi:predicted small integral membrane protein
MAQVLHWEAWSFGNKVTFLWTIVLTLKQMNHWSRSLSPAYLQKLFG